MPGDVALDELQQYGRHICTLGRGCGLEGIVQANFNIDVHSFCPCSFLLLDCSHLLPLGVSLYGCEYLPPVPRKVRGGGRVGLCLPGNPADLNDRGQLHLAELEGGGHQA